MRFGKGRLFGRRTSAPGTPVAARRHARAAAKTSAQNSRATRKPRLSSATCAAAAAALKQRRSARASSSAGRRPLELDDLPPSRMRLARFLDAGTASSRLVADACGRE
ncbi:hypothetical protein MTO96_000392 [Rhipicephalus appendiculatus]